MSAGFDGWRNIRQSKETLQPHIAMLAKLTAKNQLTLPKAAVEAAGNPTYFDIAISAGQLRLTPIRLQHADAVRAKLAELNVGEDELAAAVAWARERSPAMAAPGVAERRSRYDTAAPGSGNLDNPESE